MRLTRLLIEELFKPLLVALGVSLKWNGKEGIMSELGDQFSDILEIMIWKRKFNDNSFQANIWTFKQIFLNVTSSPPLPAPPWVLAEESQCYFADVVAMLLTELRDISILFWEQRKQIR